MASNVSKGNYYKRKTREWYQKQGYKVVLTEFAYSLHFADKVIWKKFDLLGSDGIAWNDKEFILWNSKATTEDVKDGVAKMKSAGKIEYEKHKLPDFLVKQVVVWLPRKEPIIFNV